MSSRQLRKLQKQREQGQEQEITSQEHQSSDDEEEPRLPTTKPRVNLFAALGGGTGGDDDDSAEERENQGQNDEEPRQEIDETPSLESPPKSQKNKNKKKKKNKKKETAAAALAGPVGTSNEGEEDEIDKAMRELGVSQRDGGASSPAAGANSAAVSRINKLFKISTNDLKPIHEMRNLFGRDVIESANAEEEQENIRRVGRRVQQQVDLETFLREPPWAKKLPEVSLRRNVFVHGREHWPLATAGGLTMEAVGTASDGSKEYAYSYDLQYDSAQAVFFALVQMGDPMQMVQFLKKTPYHISTLLQVSSVAKQDQNMALAAELCERALFTFGRTTTSSFRYDLENGRARLDFRRPENRQLWLAGYHYIKSLVRKGTYKTALEWAKLLFSLDPKDPYAMRHYIHFLAIKAYESSWLLGFLNELGNLSDAGDTIYLQQTLVLALLQKNDVEKARDHLVKGMQQVPWLYCALFQELHLDAPPSIWGINAESNTRTFWVKLYLYQAKELWNNAQATALLQDVAKGLSRVSTADLPADDPPVDRGAVRLAFLEGQTGLMGVAPREILESQPNYEFDPLPPLKEDNIFSSLGTKIGWPVFENDEDRAAIMVKLQREVLRRAQRQVAMRGPLAQAGEDHDHDHDHDGEDDGGDDMGQFDDLGEEFDEEDEELQRDIAAAAFAMTTDANEDDPGLIARILRMLRPTRTEEGEEHQDEHQGEHEEGAGALPGAWPGDEEHQDR